jgi:hypothetical protein
MKQMTAVFIVLFALALCGALIVRHHRRTDASPTVPAAVPPKSAPAPVPSAQPMDVLQSGVKLDLRTDQGLDAETKRRLLERLQLEEQRQRPQEVRT